MKPDDPISPKSGMREGQIGPVRAALHIIGLSFQMAIKQAMTDAFILFAVIVQPLMIAFLALYVLDADRSQVAVFVVV